MNTQTVKPELKNPEMKAKLLAEFMGWKEMSHTKSKNWMLSEIIDGISYAKKECSLSQMQFHKSWDWLMPVCYKIKTHQIPEIDDTDEINHAIMALWKDISNAVACINIEMVFNACVNYISWCNCQLKGGGDE